MTARTSLPSLQSLYGQSDDLLEIADDPKHDRLPSRRFRFRCGDVCYTYIHPNSYRQAYRFLKEWQREWGNYERRHPSDESGLPVDPNEPPMASLESLMTKGWDVADLRDPLEGADISEFAMRLAHAKEGKFERMHERTRAEE